jgi:hypothetical protein
MTKSAGAEPPRAQEWIDIETDTKYREIGRRQLDGSEWVDLALVDFEPRELARSVRIGLFNRIFKPAQSAASRPSEPSR